MLGAEPALEAGIPAMTVDAVESRSFSSGVQVLKRMAGDGTLAPNVVVHLGNNGTISTNECDDLMQTLQGHRVLIVNVKVPRDYETRNNDVLRDCATRYGASLGDWRSLAVANPQDIADFDPLGGRSQMIRQHDAFVLGQGGV